MERLDFWDDDETPPTTPPFNVERGREEERGSELPVHAGRLQQKSHVLEGCVLRGPAGQSPGRDPAGEADEQSRGSQR